jgi:hypothetical protein
MPIPERRLRAIVLEALRRDFGNQWLGLTQAVAWVAIEGGMYPAPNDTRIVQLQPEDEPHVRAVVDALLAEGVLTRGIEGRNADWPWLSLTPRGRELVGEESRPWPSLKEEEW